jgi:hypothetical protein
LSEVAALGEGDVVAGGVGEGDEVGAVGVGTGGSTQQIGFVGFFVRIGLAFSGALGTATTGSRSAGVALITGAGRRFATAVLGVCGERPICASAVLVAAAGGSVPAAAAPSSRIGTSPFTTTR